MSIKTFPDGPDRNSDNLVIFLVISMVLHVALAVGLISFPGLSARILPKPREPVIVDVVDLPPGPVSNAVPKNPTHLADRAQSVPKETYPEPSKTPRLFIPKPSAPAVKEKQAPPKGVEKTVPASKPAEETAAQEKIKTPQTVKAASDEGKSIEVKKEEIPKEEKLPLPQAGEKKTEEITKQAKTEEAVKPVDRAAKEEAAARPADRTEKAEAQVKPQSKPLPPEPDAKKGTGGAKEASLEKPRPSLFPTPERIAELEKKYEAEAPKGEKGKTLQLNTSETRYQAYLLNMKRRIEFYWEYPEVAARSGWQGTLRIDFTINKDGTVSDINVVKSSNYPVLDDAAVTAIRLANPFPPFPDNFGIEQINIKGGFEYSIVGQPYAR